GQTFNVRHRFDVGEFARLLLLQGLEKLRQCRFVSLPCQFHRLLLGREALELFGGFVLTAEKIALGGPLALGQTFLRRARGAREELLVFLRPRPRRLDGRKLGGSRISAFGLRAGILCIYRSGAVRRIGGRFFARLRRSGGRARGRIG